MDYDCNSANHHWSHESRLGPRHRSGPLQNSQQFGQYTEKRAKSLPSQFGQKYDHNSARNTHPAKTFRWHRAIGLQFNPFSRRKPSTRFKHHTLERSLRFRRIAAVLLRQRSLSGGFICVLSVQLAQKKRTILAARMKSQRPFRRCQTQHIEEFDFLSLPIERP